MSAEPGNSTSIASRNRSRKAGGPATVSGVVRRLGQFGSYVKAGVEPAAAAEGVATTEELKSHWGTSRSRVQMASRIALDRLQRHGERCGRRAGSASSQYYP